MMGTKTKAGATKTQRNKPGNEARQLSNNLPVTGSAFQVTE